MEGSNTWLNSIGGTSLYNREEFAQYGISLSFLRTKDIEYHQFQEPFIPNLSIVDVLMHNGQDGTRMLLDEYTLL